MNDWINIREYGSIQYLFCRNEISSSAIVRFAWGPPRSEEVVKHSDELLYKLWHIYVSQQLYDDIYHEQVRYINKKKRQ